MEFKKSDLRNFVELKTSKRISIMYNEYDQKEAAMLQEALEKDFRNPSITKNQAAAETHVEQMRVLYHETEGIFPYDFAQALGHADNNLFGVPRSMKFFIRDRLRKVARQQAVSPKFGSLKHTKEAFDELLQDRAKLEETVGNLETLKSELMRVITMETTAKRAYKAMAALNVDLTDFEPGNAAFLPAVMKLSVDPSILKGE